MKNLFQLSTLSVDKIKEILNLAIEFKNGRKEDLSDKTACNLFLEPSTRTHYSFNMAEFNLGMKVINFENTNSSILKGETLYDTCKTLESIGVNALVIRSREDMYFNQLDNIFIPIFNAGDGKSNHPTQSLLDLMTIYEHFNHFEGLNVCIIGDIKHSRVAHTNIEVMRRLNMNVYISGPKEFNDDSAEYIDFDEAVEKMDVIMLLRVQFERHEGSMSMTNEEYHQQFGLTEERVNKMKDNAIIMHPAPVNRNIEIADNVVECSKSKIFPQMTNGVYVRMAVIYMGLNNLL
jgi:aspartate carbamoyltransferase catalytic subunit